MRVDIRFIDELGKPSTDYVEGFPVVDVLIEVGFERPADPNAAFTPQYVQTRALIDTGANYTIIRPDLAIDKPQVSTTTAHSMLGQGYGSVHNALLEIVGFKPTVLEVATAPLKSVQIVLGRDMLSKYRMIYDPPNGVFYLEG